jgi:tRNA (cytidine/uridine-2'-O-)-methyltransferase
MISIALVEPEIPPNTGNIARLCAATKVPLHIVGATGFRLDDRAVRRAGLDYWPEVILFRHSDLEALYSELVNSRFIYLTTKADRTYLDWAFQPNDCLVFGRETRGLPESLLRSNWERCLRIPMPNPRIRSLNLAVSRGSSFTKPCVKLVGFNETYSKPQSDLLLISSFSLDLLHGQCWSINANIQSFALSG